MGSKLGRLFSVLPDTVRHRVQRLRRPMWGYMLLRPTRPISDCAGFDRGKPVDRYFIEQFLRENCQYIRGECLEVQNAGYVTQFGDGVTRIDVLDIDRKNPRATVYGDLRRLEGVADGTYDCFILTQTLQYIDDLDAAVRESARILKPGGTLLVTLPALHKEEPGYPHYWRFTTLSAKYLLAKCFPESSIQVGAWGNVMSSMAAWIGLAQEDLGKRHLTHNDTVFPCIISVRATKPLA